MPVRAETSSRQDASPAYQKLVMGVSFGIALTLVVFAGAELVDVPSPRKKAMRTLTPSEIEVLFDTAQYNCYYPVTYTAVSTGLRQATAGAVSP